MLKRKINYINKLVAHAIFKAKDTWHESKQLLSECLKTQTIQILIMTVFYYSIWFYHLNYFNLIITNYKKFFCRFELWPTLTTGVKFQKIVGKYPYPYPCFNLLHSWEKHRQKLNIFNISTTCIPKKLNQLWTTN